MVFFPATGRQPSVRPALRRFQRAVSSIQQEQQVIRKFPSNRDRLASVFERGSLTMGTGIGLYSQADKTESRQAPGRVSLFHSCDALHRLHFEVQQCKQCLQSLRGPWEKF